MKVSLITVTFNSEKYLEDCINSVRRQDYKDIEHIIIDGASTDGTLAIIHKHGDHIARYISEWDHGIYDALNKGMAMATGDIIGTLNSDDMLASRDVISSIVNTFQTEQVDSLYGDLVYVDPIETTKIMRIWKGLPYKRERFNWGWMPAHPTFYFKRELLAKLGEYEAHYFTASDFEFMARYLYRFRISCYYLPKLIVTMRRGGASNGNLWRRLRVNRRDYLAMKKNKIHLPLIVSWLKPIRKMPQYTGSFLRNLFPGKNKGKLLPIAPAAK